MRLPVLAGENLASLAEGTGDFPVERLASKESVMRLTVGVGLDYLFLGCVDI